MNAHPTSAAFAQSMTEKFQMNEAEPLFAVQAGRRFDRIIQSDKYDRQRGSLGHVHAFVERETGYLIKAATWKAPQKDVHGNLAARYNLTTEMSMALEDADLHGSYLYVRL